MQLKNGQLTGLDKRLFSAQNGLTDEEKSQEFAKKARKAYEDFEAAEAELRTRVLQEQSAQVQQDFDEFVKLGPARWNMRLGWRPLL